MHLTEHAQKLKEAIAAGGGEYVDRKFIAARLERQSVNGSDIAVLDLLVLNGEIEELEQDTKAPSGVKKLYRVAS